MPAEPKLQTRDLTTRELSLRHESVDVENRTFEAVVATETRAQVWDMRTYEVVDEILRADGGDFPNTVVMLDNHQRSSGINAIVGSATSFRREGKQWIGKGVVGRGVEGNPYREQVWQDLQDGHIRAVSIGYQVTNYVDIPAGQKQKVGGVEYEAGERTLRISTAWRVHELSLTPIGADEAALIRTKQDGQASPQKRSYFAK